VKGVDVYDHGTRLGAATLHSDGTWVYTASGLTDGSHAFTVVATDKAGNASAPISAGSADLVDATIPTMSITGENVYGTHNVAMTFSSHDNASGVSKVEYWLDHNATDAVRPATWTNMSASATSVTLDYSAVKGEYFHMVAVDNAGNLSTFSNWLIH
jgi:hypothetical protein